MDVNTHSRIAQDADTNGCGAGSQKLTRRADEGGEGPVEVDQQLGLTGNPDHVINAWLCFRQIPGRDPHYPTISRN